MPAPPSRSSLFPTGALLPATFKTLLAQWFDYMLPLLGNTGNASDARAALGAAADADVVKVTGAQTVAGVKTFSDRPIIPDATAPQNPVSKSQLDAALAPSELAQLTFVLGSPVSLSGFAAVDLTDIPSWVNRVTVTISGASTNGSSGFAVQVGHAGGMVVSGYECATANSASSTSQFILTGGSGAAAGVYTGVFSLRRHGEAADTWVADAPVARIDSPVLFQMSGGVSLPGDLTQLRFKTGNGTDVFDGGEIALSWE